MTSYLRILAIFAVVAAWGAPSRAEESTTAAKTAVHAKTSETTAAQFTAWPGYYSYGVYYGSYRWRYQPYYTYYASPWYDYGLQYTAYSYGWPTYGYGYGYGYAPYSTWTWPYYGAYGYTYYGPVAYPAW